MAAKCFVLIGSTVGGTMGSSHTSWATIAAGIAAGIAAIIAGFALLNDRFYRRRTALWELLGRFEAAGFYVLVWTGERMGRPSGKSASSLDTISVSELLKHAANKTESRRVSQLLASDPNSDRAGMHEVYFFALQTHAWLTTSWLFRRRTTRLINDTFGYQLLSTFLDHRIFACRLRRVDRSPAYYAEQWGCLDSTYRDLVRRLGKDLLTRRRQPLSPGLADPLREKFDATERELDELAAHRGNTA